VCGVCVVWCGVWYVCSVCVCVWCGLWYVCVCVCTVKNCGFVQYVKDSRSSAFKQTKTNLTSV
jgi:hypothetical protein